MSAQPEVKSWQALHAKEFSKPYFKTLKAFLVEEIESQQTVYPHPSKFLAAFDLCPLDKVKVVIIGQDPYHGPAQAHGLSFSVQKGVKTPPSLQNIYKELKIDLNLQIPSHGNLDSWAQQGVLLLNSTLSVRKSSPASHAKQGWETFTDQMIQSLSDQKQHLVFLLWGKFAQSKASLINPQKHLILQAAHPSPFSAHNGFFGCQHFSKTNQYLTDHKLKAIDWQIV